MGRVMDNCVSLCLPVVGKIGGIILLLMLLVLFVSIHSRNNEMVYVALLFVFLAMALFTYGFWSAVSKGEGIWQYVGKHNLQHQQVSSPNYHYGTAANFKGHPKSKVHVVAPPKMGGVRLEIYTLTEDEQLRKVSSDAGSEPGHHTRQHSHRHHHHHRHRHSDYTHRLYHQTQHEKMLKTYLQPDKRDDSSRTSFDAAMVKSNGDLVHSTVDTSPENSTTSGTTLPLRPGHSCMNLPLYDGANSELHELDPIKVEVNLSRSGSHQYRRHQREGFEEVQLPELKQSPVSPDMSAATVFH